MLDAALAEVRAKGPQDGVTLAGVPAREGPLRDALERAYRALAATTADPADRVLLVDRANDVRRWTLR